MKHLTRSCAIALAMLCVPPLHAGTHTAEAGPYVIRANVITADELPLEMATEHGIRPSPTVAVLNVVVQKKTGSGLQTVPANVEASSRNLLGQEEKIDMRPARTNAMVSYVGSFDFIPRQMMRFDIEVLPQGQTVPQRIRFEDQLYAPGN